MECEEISRRLDVQKSFRSIVKGLNRSPSTISRGGRRNGGGAGLSRGVLGSMVWDCATRPKSCKLAFNDPLCRLIARKLQRKWSPQQIAVGSSGNIPTRSSIACPSRRSIAALMC
ncbi:helix-turn-helix domain-containing protein [Celeribacter sp.]|uniref:helix-turn-helix domain-containing protein n=1 Tax=Celeribacter sp. TaxID=1890673 RepID=UPI003A914F4D